MAEQHEELYPRSRAPLPVPAHDPSISIPPGYVSVRHPGYDDEREIFRFVAYNKNQDGKRWIDFDFAYDMCMAVTGHVKPGFFTCERAPNTMEVVPQQGALLEGKRYFFHIDADTAGVPEMYPVIKDIRDYVFSPAHVRDHWRKAVPISQTEDGQQPEACIISGQYPHAQDAHLLPKTEWQYWKEHGLHKYALQPGPRTQGYETLTRSNIIKLSPTLHTMFDAGHFVLIPANGRLQCQWIRQSDRMALEFHSRPVRGGCHVVSPEYAYLACVYRVIGLMQEELLERGSRKTLVFAGDGETAEMTGLELGQYREQQARNTSPTKAGSRSGSPRKRSRAPEEELEDIGYLDRVDHDADLDSDSGVDVDSLTRGRRRTSGCEKVLRRIGGMKRVKIRQA